MKPDHCRSKELPYVLFWSPLSLNQIDFGENADFGPPPGRSAGLTALATPIDDLDPCVFEIDAEGIAVPIPKILYTRQSHRFCFQIAQSITVTPRKPLLFVHRAI